MNYLAHLHLAKLSNTSFSGNLMADFCRPAEVKLLPLDIIQGVKMHQFVDKTLDSHPLSTEFRAQQTIGRRRFAGIVQDLLMDYWLVNKWEQYNQNDLALFYDDFLPDVLSYQSLANEPYAKLVVSLSTHRWLADLGELKGIQKALNSIMRSWKYGDYLVPFYHALPDLLEHSETLFDQVYPDVIKAVIQEAQLS